MDTRFALDPDDPLAQPTRARLFALLTDLKRPAGTAELAEELDLHPNGVRVHLETMEHAGLVQRTREHQQRGRPRDTWTIAPVARPGGTNPVAYQDLGRWLARALSTGPKRLREIERVGREIGREIAPRGEGHGELALETTLTALGFQPHTQAEPDGRVTHCLGNCPYREAVHENSTAICTLHRGITHGLVEVLMPGSRVVEFVPRDPDRAGCLIATQVTP